uniref:Integrase catalytic domain-containing protein n=1 Tax=Cyprinus carpio TaxID=7962 RepID=A0A8C2JMD2_CYPCA
SQEFSAFAKQWDFVHTTTSPYYAQSNGLAEKTVQTAKRILTKAREEGKDPYLSILEHRNAPVDGFKSPAQLLMSRRLRSILPITGKLLQPQTCKPSAVQRKREQCQIKQKSYYDRSAKSLITLEHGARIYAQQNNGQWKPAVVSSALEDGRSYIIRNTDGQEYRRNRKHLMDVKGQNVAVSAQTTHPVCVADGHLPCPLQHTKRAFFSLKEHPQVRLFKDNVASDKLDIASL